MSDDPVTIATYDTPTEAGLNRSLLEAAGIRVFTANEATVGIAWHFGAAAGGIRLLVPGQDAERAVALLEEGRNMPPLSPADWPEEIQGERVPDGDGAGDEREEVTRDPIAARALKAAFLGLLLPPLQLYAIWLLGRIAVKSPPMNRSDWRRIAVTAVLCVYVIILGLIVLRGIFGRLSQMAILLPPTCFQNVSINLPVLDTFSWHVRRMDMLRGVISAETLYFPALSRGHPFFGGRKWT